MYKFNRVIIVALALLVLTAVSSFAEGTHPLYGTKGLFRTFSADTIATDGAPSIGINIMSLYGYGYDLDIKYDMIINPHMGITIAPIKYVEAAFHVSGVGHVRERVVETQTIEGGLSDMNWAMKGHFADQEQAWASFAALVYMDFNIKDPEEILDDPNTPGDETMSFIAEGENNIGMMGLISKTFDFGNNTALALNLNAGYLIRNGEIFKEFAHKGVREIVERPDALTYSFGVEVNPGVDIVSIILEASGLMNTSYESINSDATPTTITMKDNNFEVTGGVRFNGGDFAHVGLGGSYKINEGWGPYAGPDYRYFVTGSLDIPLLPCDCDGDGRGTGQDIRQNITPRQGNRRSSRRAI